MDQHKRDKKDKKHPRLPIKTYKWEDIRRARKRGGYPWTYLYKQPFNEQLDSEPFKMDVLRKSKSSSAIGKTGGVQISEVMETEGAKGEEKLDEMQIVTEPDDRSAKNSIGSIVIEECATNDVGEVNNQKPENIALELESADSLDNISQYLDREDRGPGKNLNINKNCTSGDMDDERMNEEGEDVAPVEQSNRKRKMSAESSYSRISSTKQAVLKKIKDAKNKIKVPKLTVNKLKKPHLKTVKTVSTETKKEFKKQSVLPKDTKPVYIHIPLKPPPGTTDEFSYLEFGDKSPPIAPQAKGVGSFKFLAKNIKRLQETVPDKENVTEQSDNVNKDDDVLKDNNKLEKNENEEDGKSVHFENLKPNEETKSDSVNKDNDVLKDNNTLEKNENEKDAKSVNLETLKPTEETNSDSVNKDDDAPKDNNKLEKNENEKNAKSVNLETLKPIEETKSQKDDFNKVEGETEIDVDKGSYDDLRNDSEGSTILKEENADKKGIIKKSNEPIEAPSNQQEEGTIEGKQKRARSEEPERKRKLSLESSYSRKSLSKLEFMKKLKQTSEKFKKTFSINRKNKSSNLKGETGTKELQPEKITKKHPKPKLDVKPVYIYIPLKPEEGEEKLPEDESSETSNSPKSPVTNDVQFIILTAPSDDEVLDNHSSDVPETPSLENKTFFDNKVEELKEIAKEAVNGATPSGSSVKLDPVAEETTDNKSDNIVIHTNSSNTEISDILTKGDKEKEDGIGPNKVDETVREKDQITDREKMMIDVEDGLSESFVKDDRQELSVEQKHERTITSDKSEEANLNLENIPVVKKKVSFKRRSKSSKDDSYEEISPQGVAEDPKKHLDLKEVMSDASHSASDEQHASLDASNMEEDKWSKESDHEYEPVNPPPEVQIFSSIPTVNVVEESNQLSGNRYPEVSNIISDIPVSHQASDQAEAENIAVTTQSAEISQNINATVNDKNKDPNKFQLAWKQTTDQFKDKIRNMKKPHTPQEDKPKIPKTEENPKTRKFKFEKPKFNLPKIPDTPKINLPSLPSFHMPRRNSTKRSMKERQQSTESNAGDSKKISFDFRTYPRMFKKKTKPKTEQKQEDILDLASVPRSKRQEIKNKNENERVRIPLHSEESMDNENIETPEELDLELQQSDDDQKEYLRSEDRITSHIRYRDNIDIDDEFESQGINNDDYLNRWSRGNFNPETDEYYRKQFENLRYEVTDLDYPEDTEQQVFDYNSNHNRERYSSGSSVGGQRVGGVLEEINADEFFLRQKGISQDNIEVGLYLSSEIKEAFRTPDNALSKLEDRDFVLHDSNQSLPEKDNKRKPIKKPKRKKTPHVSQERIFHGESEDEDLDVPPPSRPKRRSKRIRLPKRIEDVIPYQETIPLEPDVSRKVPAEDTTNLLTSYKENTEDCTNPITENQDNQELRFGDIDNSNLEYIDESQIEKPAAPPRKHKSLKSLTSENDSILEEITSQIETPELNNDTARTDSDFTSGTYPLKKPRKKSRTSLHSRSSLQSKESNPHKDEEYLSSSSQLFTTSENQIPCIEEPCVEDIRDSMGYAIIDKQKIRDPPLPPPRSPRRNKRSTNQTESNFFTVPRQSRYDDAPVRPLRNYSTLGQARKVNEPVTYENKENIGILQYLEIEDEHNRDLQSGDVIKKMKDRPLPAPPRPPRKSRVLRNITSKENIMSEMSAPPETPAPTTMSDEFGEEDELHKDGDQFSRDKHAIATLNTPDDKESYTIQKRLITPDYFTHHETITHGSLLVQSLSGDKIVQDSEITKTRVEERIIPVSTESEDETSSVPDDFRKLVDPPQEINSQDVSLVQTQRTSINSPVLPSVNTGIEILKAQKLQVLDLDVDTLTVNKLMAGKIIVSEIDSNIIRTEEISSTLNNVAGKDVKTPDIEPTVNEDHPLEKNTEERTTQSSDHFDKEKKTPTEQTDDQIVSEPEQLRLEYICVDNVDDIKEKIMCDQTDSFKQESNEYLQTRNSSNENIHEYVQHDNSSIQEIQNDPPEPPPRTSVINLENASEYPRRPPRQSQRSAPVTSNDEGIQEPDIDYEPPPRPPHPHLDYIPSQPPASFYALRAQKYVESAESNIPKIPRRKRPPKSLSRSSSEDSVVIPVTRRVYSRSPEPSIAQLSGQLIRTCGSTAHSALKRLITDITENLKKNADGKLDLHVMTIILLILIAGLILLGYGEDKTVVHLHHWEYFNPPRDL